HLSVAEESPRGKDAGQGRLMGWPKQFNKLGAAAFLGVPALFVLIYGVGYSKDFFPSDLDLNLDLVLLVVCVIIGMALVLAMPFTRPWMRIGAAILYAPFMTVLLGMLGLMVACANGNCL